MESEGFPDRKAYQGGVENLMLYVNRSACEPVLTS